MLALLLLAARVVYGLAVYLLLGRPWLKEPVARGERRRRHQGAARSRAGRPDRRFGRAARQRAAAEGVARAPEIDQLDRIRVRSRDRGRSRRPGRSARANRWRRSAPRRCGSSASLPSPSAPSASATACAVVSAESTSVTVWPIVSLMVSASTGKWVQPSTSVSGAAGPRTGEPDSVGRGKRGRRIGPAFLGQRHEHLAGLLHHLRRRHQLSEWRGHRPRP